MAVEARPAARLQSFAIAWDASPSFQRKLESSCLSGGTVDRLTCKKSEIPAFAGMTI
jgi:hypothetical protein